MIISMLLPAFILTVAAQFNLQPCGTKVEEIVAGLSTNEVFEWDLKQLFSGSYLSYSLPLDQKLFTIQGPLYQHFTPKPLQESANKITAIAALMESSQRVWLNNFAYVIKNGKGVSLFYSQSTQGTLASPPNFSSKIIISTDTTLTCPGLEYISKDIFLLDCYSDSGFYLKNTFKIVNTTGFIRSYDNDNYNYYQVSSKRVNIIVTMKDKNNDPYQVLFRSTPAFATEKTFDLTSVIEIFRLNGTETPIKKTILTSYDIGILIGSSKSLEYEFSLVDFEVFPKGIVYILTAYDGVLILQMDDTYQFTFIKQLKPSAEQTFEFDVNNILKDDGQIEEQIAILYKTQVIAYNNREQVSQYDLDLTAGYPSHIEVTQEFIVTQIKGVTQIFHMYTQEMIFKQVIDGIMAHLINPYYTEMIIVTQIDSRRYQITNGKLRFPSTTANQTIKQKFNVTATDVFGGQCTVPLTYKILPSNNYSIQSMRETPLETLAFDYPSEEVFTKPASGPNIRYQSNYFVYLQGKSTDLIKVSISQDLTYLFGVDQADVKFQRILSLNEDDSYLAILYQDNTKLVRTSLCKITYLSQGLIFGCRQYSSFLVTSFLTDDNFAWYSTPDAFYSAILEEITYSYLVNLYKITVKDVEMIKTISYAKVATNIISNVQIMANNIYLILGNKNQVDIYDIYSSNSLPLTETLVVQLGIVGKWNPKKIFVNPKHHSNLLIVANEDNVLVLDYHKEVTILNEISTGKGEISISIAKDTFSIVFKNDANQYIQVYDLAHLGYIRLTKELPLYWYFLSSPLKTTFSIGSGALYIVAYDVKEEEDYVILVYKPDLPLRDSLIRVIKNINISSPTSLMLSSTGTKYHLCYYHTSSSHLLYVIFDTYRYQFLPNYQNDTILQNANIVILASNTLVDPPLAYALTVSLRNTMVTLATNSTILNTKFLLVKQGEQFIPIGQDWLKGFVENVKLECSQCTAKIKFIQPLEAQRSWDEANINVVDTSPFGFTESYLQSDYLLLLSSTPTVNKIIIIDNYGKELKRFTISSVIDMQCDKVRISENYQVKSRFHVSCWNLNDNYRYLITVWCTSILTCGDQITPVKYNQQYYLRQMKVVDSYYNTNFWCIFLDAHPTDLSSYIGAIEVQLFNVSNYAVKFSSSSKYRFNGTSTAHFSDVYAWTDLPDKKTKLHIQVLTEEGHLLSYYGKEYSYYYKWFKTITDVNLPTIITSLGFEAQYNFIELVKMNWETYNSTSKNMTFSILITSKYASTQMILIYNLPSDSSSATVHSFVKASVIFQLNGYHNAVTLSGASKYDNHVLIPYYDGKKIILAQYYIPSKVNQKVISSNGGVNYEFDYLEKSKIACSARKYVAYSNLEKSKINQFQVNTIHDLREPFQFSVNNTLGDINPQILTLTLSNEFNSVTAEVKLVIEVAENLESNKIEVNSSSISWYDRLGQFLLDLF